MNARVIGQPGYYSHHQLPGRLALLIGDRLTKARLRFMAVSTIIVGCLLLMVSFATTRQNRTASGLGLGSDYLAFFDAGTILNQHNASHLYDMNLQAKLYHANLPGEPDAATLPFANAPFIALLMRPLAHLPYVLSYATWVVISLTLFAFSFAWIWRASGLNSRYWAMGLLVALSFEPFVIECLHGGQISAIGLASICATIALSKNGRAFAAGLCLSVCLYKPTLLPIVLPMLLVTRQYRLLGGFAAGAAALGAICLIAVGPTACVDYAHTLVGYTNQTTAHDGGGFQTWKFIDANSFLKLLGVPTWVIATALAGAVALIARAFLAARPAAAESNTRHLPLYWALALSSTLVVNLYVGVYDAVLLVPSAVLTMSALLRRDTDTARNLPLRFRCLLLTLWVTPWVSGLIARDLGVQTFTLVLIALIGYQMQLLAQRSGQRVSPSRVPSDRRGAFQLQPFAVQA